MDETTKMHTGIMIALYPSEAMALNIYNLLPDGEFFGPEDLHVTLAYLGDQMDTNLTESEAVSAVRQIVGGEAFPVVTAKLNGVGRFMDTHLPGMDALYLNVDSPQLPEMRQTLVDALGDAGLSVTSDHGFTPHMTVAYIGQDVSPPWFRIPPIPITFERVTLAWGDTKYHFNLAPQAEPEPEPVADNPTEDGESIATRAWNTIRKWFQSNDSPTGFKLLGDDLWFAVFTNNFQDRDGEIITEGALKRYVKRVQAGDVPMPELWYKHIPGTRHGQADWVGQAGHMVYAVGHFDDTEMGQSIKQFYKQHAGSQRNSHGFKYPVWGRVPGPVLDDEAVKAFYLDINTFEISTMDAGVESNPYTEFITSEEMATMAITEQEKQELRKRFGDKTAARIIEQAESAEKRGEKIAQMGAAYKSFADHTEPAEDTDEADKAESAANDALLPILLDSQKALADQQDTLVSLVEGLAKTVDAKVKELDAVKAQLEEKTKALETRLNERPRRIEAADKSLDEDAAKEALGQMEDGVEYDSFFGGMKVKKQAN